MYFSIAIFIRYLLTLSLKKYIRWKTSYRYDMICLLVFCVFSLNSFVRAMNPFKQQPEMNISLSKVRTDIDAESRYNRVQIIAFHIGNKCRAKLNLILTRYSSTHIYRINQCSFWCFLPCLFLSKIVWKRIFLAKFVLSYICLMSKKGFNNETHEVFPCVQVKERTF